MSNIAITTNASMDMFEMMEKGYKFAEIMAKADIIPVHYRLKPANVFIAVQTAYRMNLDPMLVMQNTFVVSGKLGMNTTFAISLANKSGLFESGIRYREEGSGDNLQVTAYATLRKGGDEISYTISMKQAKAEGWTKNSKYQTLPELMLRYRAATFLIRTHMPEVLNGMHMVEELEDVDAAKDVSPKSAPVSRINDLSEVLNSKLSSLTTAPIPEPKAEIAEDNSGSEEYIKLLDLIFKHSVDETLIARWKELGKVSDLSELPIASIQKCIDRIHKDYIASKDLAEESDE